MIKEFYITATKIRRKDGGFFLSYDGFDEKGKKVHYKPRREVKPDMPQREGVFKCHAEDTKLAKDLSTRYNEVWIRGILDFQEVIGEEAEREAFRQ